MNRSEGYNFAGLIITDLYQSVGIELSAQDYNWIKLIMKSMEDIDDYIDTKSLDEYDILSNSIISVVSNPDCPTDLPENISEYCSRIHIMLAVLGDSRLDFFIRSLRLLFDISKKTRNSQDLEEYFRYEIIEGRLS